MNNVRRNQIRQAIQKIDNIVNALQIILCDEQDAYDSMPDNLKESEKGMNSMDAQENIEAAIDALEEASSCLEEIC